MDNASRVALIRVGNDADDVQPTVKYNIENHLGSSSVYLDSSGAEINREEYYPFGETSFGSYAKKRYRYVGKEKDEESGLYYYGARYYAPWICRFVSTDPLAADYANLTPYQNANNKVINHYDIDGRQSDGDAKTTDTTNNTGGGGTSKT